MKSMRIALAAGGTGGHVFPAIAVAEILQARGYETILFTDRRGAKMMPDIPFKVIRAASPFQRGWGRRLTAMGQLMMGTLAAMGAMLVKRPRIVIGFGGYPSFGPMASAKILGIPMMLHEQNAFVGRANHLLARQAGHLATSWPDTKNIPASVASFVAGMPVRAAFFATPRAPASASASASTSASKTIRLLVIGGSQGAAIFADLVPAALALLPDALRRRLSVVQQCRPEQNEALRATYAAAGIDAEIAPFFDDVPTRMAASDLVISRSGASSVAELAAAGCAALLIPLPSAMDDHQTANAQQLVATGGAVMLPEKDLDAPGLAAALTTILSAPDQRDQMNKNARQLAAPDAATRIADYALALVGMPEYRTGGRG